MLSLCRLSTSITANNKRAAYKIGGGVNGFFTNIDFGLSLQPRPNKSISTSGGVGRLVATNLQKDPILASPDVSFAQFYSSGRRSANSHLSSLSGTGGITKSSPVERKLRVTKSDGNKCLC